MADSSPYLVSTQYQESIFSPQNLSKNEKYLLCSINFDVEAFFYLH